MNVVITVVFSCVVLASSQDTPPPAGVQVGEGTLPTTNNTVNTRIFGGPSGVNSLVNALAHTVGAGLGSILQPAIGLTPGGVIGAGGIPINFNNQNPGGFGHGVQGGFGPGGQQGGFGGHGGQGGFGNGGQSGFGGIGGQSGFGHGGQGGFGHGGQNGFGTGGQGGFGGHRGQGGFGHGGQSGFGGIEGQSVFGPGEQTGFGPGGQGVFGHGGQSGFGHGGQSGFGQGGFGGHGGQGGFGHGGQGGFGGPGSFGRPGQGGRGKPGSCPPVRPECPSTRTNIQPVICRFDNQCTGIQKCCRDVCLQPDLVCKNPL